LSAPPLLSIGVPVYNGERYVAEALDSALQQDYPELEVLISDNGSTDSTPEICREFESDARVRYTRCAETIEPIPNFGRVLGMARGTYFTWLAHDDVLLSPSYGSTLVATLESDADVILSASALEVFRDEDPGVSSVLAYPRVATSRPWRLARRGLFRWPPGDWETLIYGVFRRDALQRHFAENPTLRYPLQRLAFAGRFRVVPEALRGYRLHPASLSRERVAKSDVELLFRGLRLKFQLLGEAARAPAPLVERLPLIGVALRNFLGAPLAWVYSVRREIRSQEAELATLAAAAREREALIRRNGGQPPAHATIEPGSGLGRRSPGWFSRPDEADAAYLTQLTAQVAGARRVCDELLAAIEASR
jgi:glycosyltransferase involved in cell wall biosynthesis